jgi:3-hydroxypropanoate dehydrogenase
MTTHPSVGSNSGAISAAAADTLFRDAHTAYSFTDEPVSDELLAEIYDLVRHAPTAMNSQPLRVVFIRSTAAKSQLLPCLSEGNRAKSESAPVVAILAADTDFHEKLPQLLPMNPDARATFAGDDNAAKREQHARFNATLQVGYFILAVRAVGLDAGPMAGFDKAAVDEEFFAGTPLRSVLVVNIGHVAEGGNFPRKAHVPFEDAVTVL